MNNGLTSNVNLLSPNGFKLVIDHRSFANVEFFVTSFTIPTLNMGEVETIYRGHMAYVAGEPLRFDSLSIRFAIDENMTNYNEIYNWIKSNHENNQLQDSDMSLMVLTSHNNINKEFKFTNAFPTSLSGVEFNVQSTDVEYLQADVTFRYDTFKMKE
tara:strand:- start:274 stop:744 length:471 start_codon:yes stop_codon:yes gene_type:complete